MENFKFIKEHIKNFRSGGIHRAEARPWMLKARALIEHSGIGRQENLPKG